MIGVGLIVALIVMDVVCILLLREKYEQTYEQIGRPPILVATISKLRFVGLSMRGDFVRIARSRLDVFRFASYSVVLWACLIYFGASLLRSL